MKAPQSNIKLFLYTPNRFFVIPNFQRPYSWTAENVDSFISDLEEVKSGGKKHYFGSIVYVNDGDSSIIIDGQQRATTVLLMLTAIYHIVLDHPEKCSLVADQIKDEYLYNKYAKQYGTEENRIKLRAVTSDDEIFGRIFNRANLTEKEKDSKLYKSYQRFYEYFLQRSHLEDYINTLEDFEIVTIILDKDDDNPQRVFESINSTGKPLKDGDKIRNFALMLHTKAKQDHVLEHYWKQIEQALTDASKDYITDFFRTYIMSTNQVIVKMDMVYPEFKKLFNERVDEEQSIESLDAFYGDIVQSLKYYLFLRFGTDANNEFRAVENVVFIMRYLRIDLYAPFAMSVLRYWQDGRLTDEQFKQVFELIKVYFSRRLVSNLLSTSLDRYFASLHRDVLHIVETDDVEYVDALTYNMLSRSGQTRLPRDSEVETGIKANTAYSQRTINVMYLLTAVDDTSKESSLLKQIMNQDIKLSIEHIMPQTLTDVWRKDLGADSERVHNTYLHGLANLSLTGYNSELSNAPFAKKKTMPGGFDDSPLTINRTVSRYDSWGEAQLVERQAWWIDTIQKIWPLPTTSYQPEKIETRVDLLDDVSLTGSAPATLTIRNDAQSVSNWAQVLDMICEYCYETNENFYDTVKSNERIAKWFSTDLDDFINPLEIFETGIFVGVASNTAQKQQIIKELAKEFGLVQGDLIVELSSQAAQVSN